MRHIRAIPVVLAAFMTISAAYPQGPRAREEGPPDPREQLRKQFEATGLKKGSPFPEVDIYDADGKPFNTRSLKGQYTVIVNGCLT